MRKAVRRAQRLQSRAKIDIDSYWNGFAASARNHLGTHTSAFLESLPDRLAQFAKGTTGDDFSKAILMGLDKIKKDLRV